MKQEGRGAHQESIEREAEAIRDRDEADSGRAVGPLRRPMDALVIDTTHLAFDDQVARIVEAATGLTTEVGPE